MPVAPTPITALPVPPSRDDSATFSDRADAFLGALPAFRTEANAIGTNVYNNAVEVNSNATTVASNTTLAVNSANAAAGSAGAAAWVSGTTYALGAVVWSPANGQIYRRLIAGGGTTDPSLDGTNWTNVYGFTFSGNNATLSGNLTLSGGTANGVLYLNGSKVATSGSGLQFDGTRLFVGTTTTSTSSTQSGEVYSTGLVGFMLTNTTAANFPISIKNEGSSGTRNLIRFYEGSAGGTARASISLDGSNYLTFDTSNFIINTGNLGIGTASPDERLTVTATNPTDGRVASLRNNATSSLTGTKLWFNQATVDNWNIGQPAGVNAFVFCNSTGSANERLRIDGSGNLGLGVTPSAWSSDSKALQFPGGSLSGYLTSQTNLTQNAFLNASSNFVYVTTAAASAYRQISGAHSWYTAASGTAGNTITFTTAMTLDADGELGVGITSPTARVHAYSTTAMKQLTVDGIGGIKTGVNFANGGTTYGQIYFDNNSPYDMSVVQQYTTGSLIFGTNSTERARITSAGNVVAGGSVALATTATDGFLYVPTCAGTPTGTPTAITGMAPIVVNTTNNKLYFYSGGAWRDAGP